MSLWVRIYDSYPYSQKRFEIVGKMTQTHRYQTLRIGKTGLSCSPLFYQCLAADSRV